MCAVGLRFMWIIRRCLEPHVVSYLGKRPNQSLSSQFRNQKFAFSCGALDFWMQQWVARTIATVITALRHLQKYDYGIFHVHENLRAKTRTSVVDSCLNTFIFFLLVFPSLLILIILLLQFPINFYKCQMTLKNLG